MLYIERWLCVRHVALRTRKYRWAGARVKERNLKGSHGLRSMSSSIGASSVFPMTMGPSLLGARLVVFYFYWVVFFSWTVFSCLWFLGLGSVFQHCQLHVDSFPECSYKSQFVTKHAALCEDRKSQIFTACMWNHPFLRKSRQQKDIYIYIFKTYFELIKIQTLTYGEIKSSKISSL